MGDAREIDTRRRVGYMSQAFSLYSELTVRQNLVLHARLFNVPTADIGARVAEMSARFDLDPVLDSLPDQLPLGVRQRLSLAVAMVHKPELLILDEPTSGVDPVARDSFWRLMIGLAREDRVTIFISTHFMNEAARCDRISLMHAGRALVSEAPAELVRQCGAESLEAAFIAYLEEAGAQGGQAAAGGDGDTALLPESKPAPGAAHRLAVFSPACALSYSQREAMELMRDPVRGTLALLGSLLLLLIMGFGITMDVENLDFAVLDRDQSTISQSYVLNIAGSRYFTERAPIIDHADMDRRMRSGELSLALEIPPGFGRDLLRGQPVQIAAWIDGSMPQRAETAQGYVTGMHQGWLLEMARTRLGVEAGVGAASIETRFRYNPDVRSLPAIVPAVIPLLLLMIPAMLTALAVVREKELGSILNLYVTPVTRAEFLIGKQLPYVALGMLNFLLMTALAITLFGVPVKGDFLSLTLAAFIYVLFATGFGLFASTFTRSQIAAMFVVILGTVLPAVQFAGLLNPVSSLEGMGRFIGEIHPASHMLTISRGIFTKVLAMPDLYGAYWAMTVAVPVIIGLSIALLRKQER